MSGRLHFFVGTVAELIKLAPVMAAVRQAGGCFGVVASGQNDVGETELWRLARHPGPDVVLSKGPKRPTPTGLLQWWLSTALSGLRPMRRHVGKGDLVAVHGDTVSTLLGAALGRAASARVAHIEAGLRSFNLLEPFPEEACRLGVTGLAHMAFAPGEWAAANLRGRAGLQVHDTQYNTLIDSLRAATEVKLADEEAPLMPPPRTTDAAGETIPGDAGQPYFLFVLHRQENLARPALVRSLFAQVALERHGNHRCVVVLHKNTEQTLHQLGLYTPLAAAPHVTLVQRQGYIRFMRALAGAAFIVTDGGSNQEEAAYLGKPCLLLRSHTERKDGLGENALLSGCDATRIAEFLTDPQVYLRPPITPTRRPSELIADHLIRALE